MHSIDFILRYPQKERIEQSAYYLLKSLAADVCVISMLEINGLSCVTEAYVHDGKAEDATRFQLKGSLCENLDLH